MARHSKSYDSESCDGVKDQRLPWDLIKSQYRGLWVELDEYDWCWESQFPNWARVRNFAADLSQLPRPRSDDSLILFVSTAECALRPNVAAL